MKTKRIISAILASAVMVTGIIASGLTASAAAIQTWEVQNGSEDMVDRVEFNSDGSITTKKDMSTHCIWGLNLASNLEPGTYYMQFSYKATGMDTATDIADEGKIGYWEFADTGLSGRFDVPETDDTWVNANMEFEVTETIAAGTEFRWEALWKGADMQLTIGKTVVLSDEAGSAEESTPATEESTPAAEESTPAAEESTPAATSSKAGSPNTGDNTMAPFVVVAMLAAGATVALIVKKNGNKA